MQLIENKLKTRMIRIRHEFLTMSLTSSLTDGFGVATIDDEVFIIGGATKTREASRGNGTYEEGEDNFTYTGGDAG